MKRSLATTFASFFRSLGCLSLGSMIGRLRLSQIWFSLWWVRLHFPCPCLEICGLERYGKEIASENWRKSLWAFSISAVIRSPASFTSAVEYFFSPFVTKILKKPLLLVITKLDIFISSCAMAFLIPPHALEQYPYILLMTCVPPSTVYAFPLYFILTRRILLRHADVLLSFLILANGKWELLCSKKNIFKQLRSIFCFFIPEESFLKAPSYFKDQKVCSWKF